MYDNTYIFRKTVHIREITGGAVLSRGGCRYLSRTAGINIYPSPVVIKHTSSLHVYGSVTAYLYFKNVLYSNHLENLFFKYIELYIYFII